jgi:biopolymer transport protein ExbD
MIKFPRQHKIFKGDFQAGPFAAVFVLLLIFFLFNTSLVYIPGLPLQLDSPGLARTPGQAGTVAIDEQLSFRFNRETPGNLAAFADRLREEARTNKNFRRLTVQAHPAVTNRVVREVVQLARGLNLEVDLPGGRLDLPASDSLVVVTNPMVAVTINLSGQVYYQSQVVAEGRLEAELRTAVRQSRQPLTLLILADQAVEYDLIIRTGEAARAAGVRQVLLATRPALFGTNTPGP